MRKCASILILQPFFPFYSLLRETVLVLQAELKKYVPHWNQKFMWKCSVSQTWICYAFQCIHHYCERTALVRRKKRWTTALSTSLIQELSRVSLGVEPANTCLGMVFILLSKFSWLSKYPDIQFFVSAMGTCFGISVR